MEHQDFQDCIRACVACAEACEHCGDTCIGHADMANCVRTRRDCSELCWTRAGYMSRGSKIAAEVCRACEFCAEECGKHHHEHCRRCAEACRRCAAECRKMAA